MQHTSTYSAASRKARSMARCARYSLSEYRTLVPVLHEIEYRRVPTSRNHTLPSTTRYSSYSLDPQSSRSAQHPFCLSNACTLSHAMLAPQRSRCRSRARVRRAWHELCIRAHLWSPAACRSEELGVGHLNLFLLRTVRAALLRCCAPTKASTRSGLGRKQQSCFRPRQRCVTACGVGVGPPQSSVSLSLDQLCAAAFALHDWGSSKRRERSR